MQTADELKMADGDVIVNWTDKTGTSLEMDPEMIQLFRKRMGVTEPIPPLNPGAVASDLEKKRRRLTKVAEKESAAGVPASAPVPKPPAQRPPKPPSAPVAQGEGAPVLEKGKGKEVERSVSQGTVEAHVTRAKSGVHPGSVTGVSIASLVADKRPFCNELEAFEVYSPLVPTAEFGHFARMSGGELMRKICHVNAQSHTIAFGAVKKVLALERELKNSQAVLSQKNKESFSLAAKLKEARAKTEALEAKVKESRELKEKLVTLTQVNEDLGHRLKVKNEALWKAIEATKSVAEKVAKATEAVKIEGERAVKAYTHSDDFQKALDKEVEDFKTSVAGEQFLLDGIQKWQEGDDGKFLKVYNFNIGFEEFRKAAKNKYPRLDLSKVCLEDLFALPAETTTGDETSVEGDGVIQTH